MKKIILSIILIIYTLPLLAKVSAPSLTGCQEDKTECSGWTGSGGESWQAKVDTIWPARHYRELNGKATGDQRTKAWIDWKHPEGTVLVYGLHFPTGHVRADALFQAKSGENVTFGVRIVHPLTGTVVLENSATSTRTGTAEQRMEIMPETEMPYDGWYRFELTCPNGVNTLERLNLMLFQRTSTLSITDSEIFMAPSVHLWWATDVKNAPSGEAYNWTYIEALYPSAYRHQATYQMTIGADGIYSGIQMPTHADGSYGNSVLFSVWDNGDVEQDRNLPDYMRAAAVDLGPGAYATRFGGEGTGSSIRYNDDNLWQFDKWVQFLYNVRPDNTTVTVTDDNGQTQTIDYESTLQSMWFKMADDDEWRYIGTLRMAGANRLTSGIYSFLENYADIGGNLMRRCYFRNGAMRSAATGEWFPLNHAGYGHTQDNGNRYSRYDYGHGVTGLYDNCFYLESGGYMGRRDSSDTYEAPLPGEMTWVDTIDIDRLNRRIDLAVTHNQGKSVETLIEATRTVSDPATWKLVSYSDEETVGEGDNGRAAFILDGNTSTYYHNKWKGSSVGFPHTFIIEAPEPVTVSSIELYQSRDNTYRAKQLTLYTSDNGNNWRRVVTKTPIEDAERPTIQLPEPVTAQHFRLCFETGYGANLVINEVYFKHEYRLADLLALAQRLIDESDQFGGYAPADLQPLCEVYNDGQCEDADALRLAIEDVAGNLQPLTYSVVGKLEHYTPLAVYQLHNMAGRGDLVATADGQLSIAGATMTNALEDYCQPTHVTDPLTNWMLLYSEENAEYYLYNLGQQKFLHISPATSEITLAEVPSPVILATSGNGFVLKLQGKYLSLKATSEQPVALADNLGNTTIFQLRINRYMTPDEDVMRQIMTIAENAIYEAGSMERLFQEALQTYAKAFIVEPQLDTKLIRTSGNLTSNCNTTEQEIHDLNKLIDRDINTYYETWYSGINWPEERPYIQAKLNSPLTAFCFTFTPSQNPQYGQPDIPSDIVISSSTGTRNFLTITRINEGLPQSVSESYTSPVIFTDGKTRSLRFQVLRTLGEREDSRVFAMSEFQVHSVAFDELSPYNLSTAVKDAFDHLQTQMQAARPLLVNGTATPDDAQALREAIDAAEQALLLPDRIPDINPQPSTLSPLPSTLYDLSGRPLTDQQRKAAGLYIFRDGQHTKKVVR